MSQKHLKWGSHNETVLGILHSYCMKEEMTDTTLRFQDGKINAHRIILSACSPTFESILKKSSTSEIYLCHVMKSSMKYIIEFMYRGHILIPSDALAGVLQAAEYFQVKGIQTANSSQNSPSHQMVITSNNPHKEQNIQSGVVQRRYGSPSSPIRRDRPRPKNPAKNGTVMSPPTPERDKVPFRRSGNTSGKSSKSEDMPDGKQNTSDILSSPVRKVKPTVRTPPVIKEEPHSKSFPKAASQPFSKSEKHEQPSRKTKTAHSEDNSEGSSSKRTRLIDRANEVVNPFARKATILESPDSDNTFIGASVACKEINTKGAKSSEVENDVEILVVDEAPIEIMESLAEPANSLRMPDSDDSIELACAPSKQRLEPANSLRMPDSDDSELACASSMPSLDPCVIQPKNTGSGASTSRKAQQPGENFSSTDEDVPLVANAKQRKVSRKKPTGKKEGNSANEIVIKKPPPDRSKIVSKKKLEKYTKDLLDKPLVQMHQFCPVCFEYMDDIRDHIKKLHKKMPKKKYPCKVCKKEFFNKSFFDYHKCIRQEKD